MPPFEPFEDAAVGAVLDRLDALDRNKVLVKDAEGEVVRIEVNPMDQEAVDEAWHGLALTCAVPKPPKHTSNLMLSPPADVPKMHQT